MVVPDLYKGKIGVDKEEASHLMNEMDFMNAAKEIGEVAKYMKETKNVEKVGTIGFCMGGALSLLGGCTSDDVDACVVFYVARADSTSSEREETGFGKLWRVG